MIEEMMKEMLLSMPFYSVGLTIDVYVVVNPFVIEKSSPEPHYYPHS